MVEPKRILGLYSKMDLNRKLFWDEFENRLAPSFAPSIYLIFDPPEEFECSAKFIFTFKYVQAIITRQDLGQNFRGVQNFHGGTFGEPGVTGQRLSCNSPLQAENFENFVI